MSLLRCHYFMENGEGESGLHRVGEKRGELPLTPGHHRPLKTADSRLCTGTPGRATGTPPEQRQPPPGLVTGALGIGRR